MNHLVPASCGCRRPEPYGSHVLAGTRESGRKTAARNRLPRGSASLLAAVCPTTSECPADAVFPLVLGNVHPSHRRPAISLIAQFSMSLSIFARDMPSTVSVVVPGVMAPCIAVQTAISAQVQIRVEQLPIDILQRQSSLASFSDDIQNGFGVSHLAYLSSLCRVTCSPSPLRQAIQRFGACRRLSRLRTTMGTL